MPNREATRNIPFAGVSEAFWDDPVVLRSPPQGPLRSAISKKLKSTFMSLVEIAKPNIVLEIGAHEGDFSKWAASSIRDARVIAFEANPYVYEKFKGKMHGSGVEYQWAAVGRSNELRMLNIPTAVRDVAKPVDNRMGSLYVRPAGGGTEKQVEVPGVTLDKFFETAGAEATFVSWVDVEGAMRDVLAGGATVFRRCKALLCEFEHRSAWAGQLVDHELFRCLAEFELLPFLRDCERPWQYNAILVNRSFLRDLSVPDLARQFELAVRDQISRAGTERTPGMDQPG